MSRVRVRIGTQAELQEAARHRITLRHTETGDLHALLLFAVASASSATSPTYYCMEATCPHLGAPLEKGHLQPAPDDVEDFVVVWYVLMACLTQSVCITGVSLRRWHQYDFKLSTGESSTGMRTCVYAVDRRPDGTVLMEPPTSDVQRDGTSVWQLHSCVAVPEDYARLPPSTTVSTPPLTLAALGDASSFDPASVPPPSTVPTTLVAWAVLILQTPSPLHKVAYTRMAYEAFQRDDTMPIGGGAWDDTGAWSIPTDEQPPAWPPRMSDEDRVEPGREPRRGRGGTEKSRIALLHALANIEQWAIDLAWDIIARGPHLSAQLAQTATERTPASPLPRAYYADFCRVAYDEAKHFTLLQKRLIEMGSYFGALPVHHGLWESAVETSQDLLARLSIVHLVHEARGLDVNPATIRKFEAAGDARSVESLRIIHLDEITHVAAGHRWLTFLCETLSPPRVPVEVFRSAVQQHFVGRLKGPFNVADRAQAGLTRDWYDHLDGAPSQRMGVQRQEVAGG